MDFNYLTCIIFLPVLGALLIAFLPRLSARGVRWLAAVVTFIPLALSIYLFTIFDRSADGRRNPVRGKPLLDSGYRRQLPPGR